MSDEIEAFEKFESELEQHPSVAHLKRDGGEERLVAGETNSVTSHYAVHLTEDAQKSISTEQAEGVPGDPDSETLRGVQNFIELSLGGSPSDYVDGTLYASFTYHRR